MNRHHVSYRSWPSSNILEAVEATDRSELPHVDVAICHAGRLEVEIDDLAYDERVAVGAELDHSVEPASKTYGISQRRISRHLSPEMLRDTTCSFPAK
jgi:hypothetical protein